MRAVYRLSQSIAGFDFFHWLVLAKARGATEIVFDTKNPKTNKFDYDTVLKRFYSILLPGPAFAGLTPHIGSDGDLDFRCNQTDLNDYVRAGGKIEPLKSVLPPAKERYTVTLRNFGRLTHRDSNEEDWRRFAAEIGALVIPDWTVKPIHIYERMALYAGAEMNFFVTNGPVSLCFLSDYPCVGFDVQNSPPQGIPEGGSYPFLGHNQFQVWEPGNYANIRRWFDAWRGR